MQRFFVVEIMMNTMVLALWRYPAYLRHGRLFALEPSYLTENSNTIIISITLDALHVSSDIPGQIYRSLITIFWIMSVVRGSEG